MNRNRISSFVLGCALALSSACSSNDFSITGTETNWLEQCDSDSDCGAYACYCGVCSASCNEDNDCDHESVVGSCQPSTGVSACNGDAPKRICVLDDELARDASASTNDSHVETLTDVSTANDDSTTTAQSSGDQTSNEPPTFAYAAIPCERRAPSQCYQGDECYAIFALEVDGSDRVVGCTLEPSGEGFTCAVDQFGIAYQVSGNVLPDGWTTTTTEACEPECFSPWLDLDRAQSPDAQGCPCTAPGSVCIEGVGFECVDATDDLQDDRAWQVTSRPCDEEPNCSGGFRLTECLAMFHICTTGGVVLDTDRFTYCGEPLLSCGLRTETACNDDCEPVYGKINDNQAFGGCVEAGTLAACGSELEPHCVQQLTPQTSVPARGSRPVLIETCEVPAGFTQLDASSCEDSALSSSCADRDADTCNAPCFPYTGRRAPGGAGEFIACGDNGCSASRTICAEDGDGNHVEFFGCLAPGWTEVGAVECDEGGSN